MPRTLINVSNRLPVTMGDSGFTKSSGGLVAALEGLPREQYALRWIGWPGSVSEDRQADVRRQLAEQAQCAPVFLTDQEERGFYEGFSNSSVWPLLHYMPSRFRYEGAWWDDYERVNRKFAHAVLNEARDGDLVWVHDYQLMLLPAMLKEANPSLRVGFFLHTPFPSYEVFRCHPRRDELVAGMLGADQVGFHTFNYMRHFRSSVLRLLGLESEITRIRHGGRTTYLGIYPIGINAPKFEKELDRPELRDQIDRFRQTFDGKQIVLSVERLDYTKGIVHRLDAIDLFLADREEERDHVKFIFVSVPSRENVEEYRDLREEVEARIGRLNGKYTTLNNAPLHFIHGSVDFTELCALYALADVCIVTPLIDGMNLVAKEYVAAQRDARGVLVLSEFAGAAEELLGAISVNPYDAREAADAIADALKMPAEERRHRMQPMRQRVMSFDAATWARNFVDDLAARDVRADDKSHADDARAKLSAAVRAGQRIALFLDYDGTLREIERDPAAATPTPELRQLLDLLCARDEIDVTIISGRTPDDLESFLGDYPFGLIAEHGAAIRRPKHGEWEQLDRNVSYAWMDELMRVLKVYEGSTPGSFIETKRTSLVWHYRRADPEFGAWKAKQLTEELAVLTASDPLQVRHGRKIVEITTTSVNKGAAILRILEERTYDLILVAGDDRTDESMFKLDLRNLLTMKVGDGDTQARFRLPTPTSLRRFLADALTHA